MRRSRGVRRSIDVTASVHRAPARLRRREEAAAPENRGERRQRRRRVCSWIASSRTLPFEFIKLHHEPDGRFPNGVPNPMLEENRAPTVAAIRAHGADLGLAWDGDFDRCFFFDEHGEFIEGYYLVGLLAVGPAAQREPRGGRIVHDPRLTWNTLEIVAAQGGEAVLWKSGHAFIKQRMREVDGVYGGEMSAHHYFRRFAYCDSGMIPWLSGARRSSASPASPSRSWSASASRKFPVSGEINYRVPDAAAAMAAVEARYAGAGARERPHRRAVVRIRRLALQSALARTPSP